MLEAKRRAAIFFILAFILAAATGYNGRLIFT
jgi:hypothetical protein